MPKFTPTSAHRTITTVLRLAAQRFAISTRAQWQSELRRMDREDRQEYLRAWTTFGSLLFTSAAFRRYIRELWPSSRSVFRMFGYFGYGIFVGKKSSIDTGIKDTSKTNQVEQPEQRRS